LNGLRKFKIIKQIDAFHIITSELSSSIRASKINEAVSLQYIIDINILSKTR